MQGPEFDPQDHKNKTKNYTNKTFDLKFLWGSDAWVSCW
jgi:hypothetical protein